MEAIEPRQVARPVVGPRETVRLLSVAGAPRTTIGRPLVLAHRGSPACPTAENTVAAVAAALAAGVDGIEIDARLTADGYLVCSHDPFVADADGHRLDVATSTFEALRRAGLPGGHQLATVEEILATALGHRRCRVVVEAKPCPDSAANAATAAALRSVLQRFAPALDITLSSFDPALLAAIRAAHADLAVRTALLGDRFAPVSFLLEQAVEGGYDEIHPYFLGLFKAPEIVAVAHDLGRKVTCWTANRPKHISKLAFLGVDAIITDNPRGALGTLAVEPAAGLPRIPARSRTRRPLHARLELVLAPVGAEPS